MKRFTTKDKIGIAFIVVSIFVVLSFGYIAYDRNKKSLYDPNTLCPLVIPYETTVVIIDKSDPWQRRDSLKIKRLLHHKMKNLKTYERLTIKVIEPNSWNETEVKTYFDMCNPGRQANPLYQNPKRILKKYQENFQKPLDKILHTLMQPKKSNSSPLLETLQDTLEFSESSNLKIILISDLLEYTEGGYNFYSHIPSPRQIIEEFSFPQNKLKVLSVEYIMRKHHRKKIYKALKFFKRFTKELGGQFKSQKLLQCK